MNKYFVLLTYFIFLCLTASFGQVIGGNAYFFGDYINIGVSGDKGREGTDEVLGIHARGGDSGMIGFTADPNETDWDSSLFHGDFFLPGTPENGFGLEIGGVEYNNNYNVYQIPASEPILYETSGECSEIIWKGAVAGLEMIIIYKLKQQSKYYTTEIKLINTTDSNLTDVYYHRSFDPDNNQSIGGSFLTTNTIVSQPDSVCQKALVSATQELPFNSYVGLGAVGMNWRAVYGGFSNRDASALWNGLGTYTTIEGDSETADIAIGLSYKTSINSGDSVTFSFSVILDEEALGEVFTQSSFNLNFRTSEGIMGEPVDDCDGFLLKDTITVCQGNPVQLFVEGSDIDYDLTWTPSIGLDTVIADTVIATPETPTAYTVSIGGEDCISLTNQYVFINPFSLESSISDDVVINLGESTILEASGGDIYSWFPSEGLSDPTSATTTATPTETTTYFALISSSEDYSLSCIDTLSVLVTVLSDMSASEKEEYNFGFTLYPNPSDGYLNLNFSKQLINKSELIIYDVVGNHVFSQEITKNKTVIDSGKLKKGIYFIAVLGNDSTILAVKKIIVN